MFPDRPSTEASLSIGVLTIGEYEKGIANLPDDEPRRPAPPALRDGLIARFGDRLLPVSADTVVRRWGVISGSVERRTGHLPPGRAQAGLDVGASPFASLSAARPVNWNRR